jgi:ABC-type transport system involved in multi-copper enzyme maturation permease subunit
MTRRTRYFIFRMLFIGAVAALWYWQYVQFINGDSFSLGVPADNRRLAAFATEFFARLMVLQFSVIAVLTPLYTAGAIADEKERKTLEYLFATDLANREIVLSKVASRLLNLTLIVMTGVPIVGVIQLLGGIDPNLVVAGFAATALSMLSLGCFGILCSVYARKSRNAIIVTYLGLVVFLALGYLVEGVYAMAFPMGGSRATPSPEQVFWREVVLYVNGGNLPLALWSFNLEWAAGKPVADLTVKYFVRFAGFHLVISGVCLAWSIAKLRAVALEQSMEVNRRTAVERRARRHWRLGRFPMVWKEVFVDSGLGLNRFGKIAFGLVFILSMLPAIYIWYDYYSHGSNYNTYGSTPGLLGSLAYRYRPTFGTHLNPWARLTGTVVATLMLLAVAVRASTSISGERDKDTMDALLASPLNSHDILFAKWLGCILSVRVFFWWLGLIWAIGVLTGALDPVAPALVFASWLVYASAYAGIGLWYSTASRTSMRSMTYTLLTCIAVSGGHWAAWFCCLPLGLVGLGLEQFQAALTPPFVLYWFSAGPQELNGVGREELMGVLSLCSLLLWGVACLLLWTFCRGHFRRLTARYSRQRPRLGVMDKPPLLPYEPVRPQGWGMLEEG